jgi:hypothetical protein
MSDEYQVHLSKIIAPLYFCPHCGGRLPSRRDELFDTPSELEVAEVQSKLSACRSMHDVLAALGPADEIVPWSNEHDDSAAPWSLDNVVLHWKRAHQYSTQWKTLNVHVYEMADGTITHALSGKYVGQRGPQTPAPKPW